MRVDLSRKPYIAEEIANARNSRHVSQQRIEYI
jgi:hypothetical protein